MLSTDLSECDFILSVELPQKIIVVNALKELIPENVKVMSSAFLCSHEHTWVVAAE